jgi:hypothetical protein
MSHHSITELSILSAEFGSKTPRWRWEDPKNGRVVSKRSVINHEESSSWINIVRRRRFSDKTTMRRSV